VKLITHLHLVPRLDHSQQDLTSWFVGIMNNTNTNTNSNTNTNTNTKF